MIFEYSPLPPVLQQHIESIIYFKDFMPQHSIERVVPTGHIFILFELDNIPRHTYDNESLEVKKQFSKVWISGIHRNYISISAHEHSEMLVIQFKPTGAYPFFHFQTSEINDTVLSAEEVFGQEILDVRDEILAAKTVKDKFDVVQNWLSGRYDPKKAAPEPLVTFVKRLQEEPSSNLAKIVSSYPFTQKQLITHFKNYIGITPKFYHRIVRFNEILRLIQNKEEISWSDIAYSGDYADQSHFIKEFYLFSGFNPGEFLKMDFAKEETNFFPLDKKG